MGLRCQHQRSMGAGFSIESKCQRCWNRNKTHCHSSTGCNMYFHTRSIGTARDSDSADTLDGNGSDNSANSSREIRCSRSVRGVANSRDSSVLLLRQTQQTASATPPMQRKLKTWFSSCHFLPSESVGDRIHFTSAPSRSEAV